MILAPEDNLFNLKKFGIEVPLDERINKTVEYLQNHYDDSVFFKNSNEKLALDRSDLLLAHSEKYIDLLYSKDLINSLNICFEVAQYGVDQKIDNSKELFESILIQGYYTAYAMDLALENGLCYYLGGGMHHALLDQGRGFCLVNDIIIGIKKLQKKKKIINAWVIDVDAHKGDGTAELSYNDKTISTLSIHMKDGWPMTSFDSSDPCHIPSDIDIPISKNDESSYLKKLEFGLNKLSDLNLPDIAIVIDGSDPYVHDELSGSSLLRLTIDEMLERDQMIYKFLKNKGIPQTYLMGGGYGARAHEVYINFLIWLIEEEKSGIRKNT